MHYDPRHIYPIAMGEILTDHEFNCRGPINPSEVRELAVDIREKGLTQPVVVQPWTKHDSPNIKFRLVAGYRRHAAHLMNGATAIDAVVREGLSDIDARILNLSENIQRTQLNVLQEAQAISHLKNLGMTQEGTAARLGKSRGWVQERYYLLELPDEIQEEAAAGVLTMKDVRFIWSLPSTEQQYKYVRDLKDQKLLGKKRPPNLRKLLIHNEKRARTKDEMLALQDVIRETFGNNMATRVIGYGIGEVDDRDIHSYLHEQAQRVGKFYTMPQGLGQPKMRPMPAFQVPEDDSDLEELRREAAALQDSGPDPEPEAAESESGG